MVIGEKEYPGMELGDWSEDGNPGLDLEWVMEIHLVFWILRADEEGVEFVKGRSDRMTKKQ